MNTKYNIVGLLLVAIMATEGAALATPPAPAAGTNIDSDPNAQSAINEGLTKDLVATKTRLGKLKRIMESLEAYQAKLMAQDAIGLLTEIGRLKALAADGSLEGAVRKLISDALDGRVTPALDALKARMDELTPRVSRLETMVPHLGIHLVPGVGFIGLVGNGSNMYGGIGTATLRWGTPLLGHIVEVEPGIGLTIDQELLFSVGLDYVYMFNKYIGLGAYAGYTGADADTKAGFTKSAGAGGALLRLNFGGLTATVKAGYGRLFESEGCMSTQADTFNFGLALGWDFFLP